jgi:hypothetical protein
MGHFPGSLVYFIVERSGFSSLALDPARGISRSLANLD